MQSMSAMQKKTFLILRLPIAEKLPLLPPAGAAVTLPTISSGVTL
jgi:hypothetical protein